MKIAHIADIHLGYKSLPYICTDAFMLKINKRENDIYESFRGVICEILLHNPDVLVIAGDLFDSRHPSNLAIKVAVSVLKDIEIPILLIPGNHDKVVDGDISPCTLLSYLCPTISCVESFADFISLDDYTFYLMPTASLNKSDQLPLFNRKFHILIAHAPIGGPEEYRFASSFLDTSFTDQFIVCLFGDLHRYYKKGNILYPGSLERFSFNEVNNSGGYIIIDLDKGNFKSTFYPWEHSKKMVDIEVNSQEELEKYKDKISGAIVRITSSVEIDTSLYKDLAYHISFRLRKESQLDLTQITGVTLQEMWINYLKDTNKEHLLEVSLPFWKEAITNKSGG